MNGIEKNLELYTILINALKIALMMKFISMNMNIFVIVNVQKELIHSKMINIYVKNIHLNVLNNILLLMLKMVLVLDIVTLMSFLSIFAL